MRLQIFAFAVFAFCLVGCQETMPPEETGSAPSTEATIAADLPGIVMLDSALQDVIDPAARPEVLARGFSWSEGPLWLAEQDLLIFSDVPRNTVHSWRPGDTVAQVYLRPSGFSGEKSNSAEPGSNGLLLTADGRLVLCQHGDRRVAVMDFEDGRPKAQYATLADNYQGKRFNSPNDAAFRPGTQDLYFTDPPYGLPGHADSELKELDFYGVFRLQPNGDVSVMDDRLTRPNGIAFSPDGRTAYVACSDPEAAHYYAYDIDEAGDFTNRRLFFDATVMTKNAPGLPDGLKVNQKGILFATGPGGVLVFAPNGTHLGTIQTGRATANCALSPDEKTLYMTSSDRLLRIALK